MKKLIADIYKLVYKLTHNKAISFSFALIYISLLNVVVVYGLALLLRGLVPYVDFVVAVFHRPYTYGIFVLALALNFWLMTPLQNLNKEKGKPSSVTPIIVYSLVAVLLFFYTHYLGKLF